jgi:PAS domain S-box-containing protein
LGQGLEEILAASIELLGADKGNVQLLDRARPALQIAVQRGFAQEFVDFFHEVSAEDDSACGRALRLGERIVIEDIEADPEFAPLRPIARASGFRAVQSTPLMGRDGKPLGMLSTHFRSVHRPTEQDLRRLDLYARQAADFIERARIEETLRIRARQQEAIAKLGELALREQNLDQVLAHAAAAIAETLEIEFTEVLELRPGGADLLLRAGVGWQDGLVGRATVAAGLSSQGGYTLLSDTPVVLLDLREEQRFKGPPLLVDHGVVSGMTCVIRDSAGAQWGVLGAHSNRQIALSQDDVNFLTSTANILGDTIRRHRAEHALRESEARMRAVLESAVDAIVVIDDCGLISSVNPATEKLFGYAVSEMIGQNVKMLMPEPYVGEHDGYLRRYLDTGERRIIGIGREVSGRRKDGSTFPMHLSVSEYEIRGKRHFAGILHDLTAQRQAEGESLRQQTLFQAVINDAPQAIIIADQSRNIFLVNPAMTRIFGFAAEELIGKSSRIVYANDADFDRVARLRLDLGALDMTGQVDPIQVSFRRKSGETFPGEIIATIIRDPQRNILGVLGLVRDITQQLKQESTLRQAQRMDALGQLTGGIAHDFNNLLTVIMGSHELFEVTRDPEQAREHVRNANEAAEMGARLTGRLLSFSRQRKLEPVTLDLNEQILGMMDLLRRSIGETVSVSTSLARTLGAICVDPSEIENAVLNLAINARDAMPRGGRLVIETEDISLGSDDCVAYGLSPGQYVRLSISDTGSGMPPEVVARAFEPFFTTKSAGRGTGLGLASVYGFVNQSGGNATIYSEPGRGTSVNLYLPVVSAPQAPVDLASDKQEYVAEGETVLLVEDNPEVRKLSLRRLTLLGYRVLEADNGPAALALLDAGTEIDLVFSDVVMPGGMTGYELAQHAKRKAPAVKVLLTSGYDADIASEQDPTESDLRVLRKPYRQADLAQALREVLRD